MKTLPISKKKRLREMVIAKLRKLTASEKQQIEQKMLHHLIHSKLWKDSQILGLTCSTGVEWDTFSIMKKAWKDGKVVAVPKTEPKKKTMNFYRIEGIEELQEGHYGLLEPIEDKGKHLSKKELDLLLVPGIVFDYDGYRIGFGGGYYDRFLKDYKGKTVSLVSRLQMVEAIPVEKHDLHVQYVVTEEGIVKVSK